MFNPINQLPFKIMASDLFYASEYVIDITINIKGEQAGAQANAPHFSLK